MWPLQAHAGLMGIYPVHICKLLLIGSRHGDFCLALVVQSSGLISVQLWFKIEFYAPLFMSEDMLSSHL